MSSKKPATAVTLAGILAARLTSADIPISVQHDATYSLSEFHGLPCSGEGPDPEGNSCPKAGDVATADCRPYLLSFNGTDCVAPADAHCVLIQSDTTAAYGGERPDTTTDNGEGVQVDSKETGYAATAQESPCPPTEGVSASYPTGESLTPCPVEESSTPYPTKEGLIPRPTEEVLTPYSTEKETSPYPTESRHVLPDEGGFDAVPNALPD
ncbi:hypothetical protein GN958_ATG06815 [Phytophthora infestans]|uniref:Cyst germination specific acidic repeat protein n=1 Tax=Phytophthora infestans TaxID=4787 RepID=A0A8S9UXZ1_PHYIN|nr:hypothetical protein GN958_ATG06815 [Phytophthora infestans]